MLPQLQVFALLLPALANEAERWKYFFSTLYHELNYLEDGFYSIEKKFLLFSSGKRMLVTELTNLKAVSCCPRHTLNLTRPS